jgi:hypothetical protein
VGGVSVGRLPLRGPRGGSGDGEREEHGIDSERKPELKKGE